MAFRGSLTGSSRRLTRGIELRLELLRHRGDRVQCPLCGHRFDRFKDDGDRPGALCWRCGSHERHRAQWLLFERRPELLGEVRSLLHFAPEWCLRHRLARLHRLRYRTADLYQPDVDLRLDLTAIDLPSAAFEAVICSHVLEHVGEDRAAMRELRRIIAPGGWCLVLVPLDPEREVTYEDPSVETPEARQLAFWGREHVRLYAPDIGDRLADAGFTVECIRPLQEFGAAAVERCRLRESDYLWLCRAA
jgi:SAM-dependent methyltransferase